jgi:site-specific recombinase XerD
MTSEPIVIEQEVEIPHSVRNDTFVVYVSGENVPARGGVDLHPVVVEARYPSTALRFAQDAGIDEMLEQFSRWMRLDVADGNASPATLRSYWGDVRDHLRWLMAQGLRPAQADEDLLKGYRAFLTGQYKASTAGRKFTSVRRFYDMAFNRGQLPSNPAARIKSPSDRTDEEERIKYLSPIQLQKILVLADEQYKHEAREKVKALRDQAMLLLGMRHNLREIEMARLNVEDLNLQPNGEGSTARVFGKRSKWRTIHLVAQTQTAIERWLAAHGMMKVQPDQGDGLSNAGTPLFVGLHWADNGHGKGGRRMTTRGIRGMIDGYLIKVGAKAPGVSGHALRHSYGTWSVFYGADLRAVQKEMGHSSIETTTKYSRIVDAMKSNPAKYLDFMETALEPDEIVALNGKKGKKKA